MVVVCDKKREQVVSPLLVLVLAGLYNTGRSDDVLAFLKYSCYAVGNYNLLLSSESARLTV